jgi:serine/threonine protein kinase
MTDIILSELDISESDSASETSSTRSDKSIQNIPNLEGKLLKNYHIVEMIGKGGFSTVWMAINSDDNYFYAIKYFDEDKYKDGLEELKIQKKLPNCKYINKMVDYFVIKKNDKNCLGIVYKLCVGSLDDIIRKGFYPNGFSERITVEIYYQLKSALNLLHNKIHIYHADIKPDNILLYGLNKYNKEYIKQYKENDIYGKFKRELDYNKKNVYHQKILNDIYIDKDNYDKYDFDDEYLEEPRIMLSDFGGFCSIKEHFDDTFGTYYYRAPEGIILYDCDYKYDLWSLGCTLYEIYTGKILFNDKCENMDEDLYLLKQIIEKRGHISQTMIIKSKYGKKYINQIKNFIPAKIKLTDSDRINKILEGLLHCKPSNRYFV